ncbi:Acyl-CoA synthetase short-chain family member 3, mitochondrial [Smittium culicis]|uniref:Acyl-CoA synthetase short-chain family member 3, mitochondrial n=1 Tax=Smittium culicis TaxID=133412 RepID=A0A1R1X4N8_9FUNG|nr:Acyl-CoA synthetase short-chain family member 3, mitochondrial [Smittium culicis]
MNRKNIVLPIEKLKYKQQQVTKYSLDNPDEFWLKQAKELITWYKEPSKALHYRNKDQKHFVDWYPDGKLNLSFNCLDRHFNDGFGSQTAIIYDSPVTNTKKKLTYSSLLERVKQFSKVLVKFGITKGDTVVIYMPMIPETLIAMLSVVRIGAIHSVVFGGFAPKELAKRIDDCKPKIILSASCALLDEAISLSSFPPKTRIIFQREALHVKLDPTIGDNDWVETLASVANYPDVPIEILNSSDVMYMLYTSGTTGSPKGVVRSTGPHSVALIYAMRHVYGVFPGDVFFASSDLGWAVGHSLTCYGALLNRNQSILYEGKPVGTPDPGAFFRVIEEYKVKTFFTAPTALMILRREDPDAFYRNKYDISSVKSFFLAGERCVPEIHKWWIQYTTGMKNINSLIESSTIPSSGGNGDKFSFSKNHITYNLSSDHWWQTESGAPLTALGLGYAASVNDFPEIRFGSAGFPLPGVDLRILKKEHDDEDIDESISSNPSNPSQKNISEAEPYEVGSVVLKLPLPPGNLTTLWKNDERFYKEYFQKFPGYYATGDTGYVDNNGYVFILSRDDDVINVSAHRMSTSVIEEVVSENQKIAECCVVSKSDSIKGQVPMVFAVPKSSTNRKSLNLVNQQIVQTVRSKVGAFASLTPNNVIFVNKLPKTRSGKVLRKMIRNMVATIFDQTQSVNPNVISIDLPATIEDESAALDIWKILSLLKKSPKL